MYIVVPAQVVSVNLAEMTLVAQPTLRYLKRQENGDQVWWTPGASVDVPILFYSVGQFVITLPIKPGDEVLLFISDRCINSWWQNGGIQNQFTLRTHDLADAFAFPGPKSLPNVFVNINPDNLQIRTKDGSCYIEMTPAGVVNIVAPGGVNITAPTIVDGTLQVDELAVGEDGLNVTGPITATGEITAKGSHTVSAHTHGGVQAGTDETDPPIG
jgi:hypothetical protein